MKSAKKNHGDQASWSPYRVPSDFVISPHELAMGNFRIAGADVLLPEAALNSANLRVQASTLLHANEQESSGVELLQIGWYRTDIDPADPVFGMYAVDHPSLLIWMVFHRDDKQEWKLVDTFGIPGMGFAINSMRLESTGGIPRWIRIDRGGGAGTGLFSTREEWYDIGLGRSVLSIPGAVNDANTTLWTFGGSRGMRLTMIQGRPAVVGVLWHRQKFVGSLDEPGFWHEDSQEELAMQFLAFGLAVFVQDLSTGEFKLDPTLSDWDPKHISIIGRERVTAVELSGPHIEHIRRP
jgi:hypothetical protein